MLTAVQNPPVQNSQTIQVNSLPPVSVSRDWMDGAALALSATLAFVGIVGIIAALRTLKAVKRQADLMSEQGEQMKKQTASAENAAQAALLNAQALMISERPWLLVTIEQIDATGPKFRVRAANKGKTPAILHEGHCSVVIETRDFTPPDKFMDPFYAPLQSLTVSEDGFTVRDFIPEYVRPTRTLGDMGMLYVFGRLLYWDTFTDRSKPDAKPYMTQWCFTYDSVGIRFFRTANAFTMHT